MSQFQPDYINILNTLKEKIRQARIKATIAVNVELLKLYWEIGNTILEQQKAEGWGAKIIDKLAIDLKTEFPDFTGLSVRNLKYMRAFAEAYPAFSTIVQPTAAQLQSPNNQDAKIVRGGLAQIENTTQNEFVQPPFAQIPWSHHIVILEKVKAPEERLFYIEKTVQNGWSKAVLSLQIDSNLYQRQGKAITNFSEKLPAAQSDLANETLKNPYVFDFLSFSEEIKERELERALMEHLKKFMLELGKGFSYVGNQVNLNVAGKDYFLDLLFYNYHLHCFVVFELKIGDFEPEFAGKLNLYINAVDEQVKGEEDNPTIGVLLCKTPNETVVKYSLQGISTPMGIAEYQLAQILPKELKGEIPSIEELEAEIEKEYEELKSPSQKKFETLKEKLSRLKGEEIKQTATTPILFEIIDKSIVPLYGAIIKRMEDFKEWFYSSNCYWAGSTANMKNISQLAEQWKNEGFLKTTTNLYFSYRLEGLKKAGTEAAATGFQLNFKMNTYWYGFELVNYNNTQPIVKKLYHEQLSPKEITEIVDTVYNFVMDDVERDIERLNEGK